MYTLRYSFANETSGLTVTPKYIDDAGATVGTASYGHTFEINGWYAFNIQHADNQSGYLAFYDQNNNILALFAINPQEGENMNAKVTLLQTNGPGGVGYTHNVFDTTTGFPIVDAEVWATSDVDGLNVVGGTVKSDSQGNSLFELPAGVYYFWTRHSRYKFNNPERIVVS